MLEPLTLTVKELTSEHAVVAANDGKTLRIPLASIHGTPKVGTIVRMIALAAGSEDIGKTEMAHAIVNELLG